MARPVDGDLKLTPLGREPRTIAEWTTMFHFVFVVLDPFTHESAWILGTAGRILRAFAEADCRTAFLVTGNESEAKQFLGPWAEETFTFADPDREAVKAFGLEHLPAFVHINQDHAIEIDAQGWHPGEWREVAVNIADRMSWTYPIIPAVGDPAPYEGSAAVGEQDL